jgi:hypothetical protein
MSIISKDSVVIKQVKNFEKLNANAILANNINKHKKLIVDQQKEQLKFGQGSDGKKITPSYASDDYAFTKNQKNALAGFGNPDLNLSGDMYSGLDLLVGVPNDNSYSFFSDVTYFNDLKDKYKTAFGLSAKSLKVVRPIINNSTLKDIHEFINK